MIVGTVNRFARDMDYPSLAPKAGGPVSLTTVASWTKANEGDKEVSGLGAVLDDITSGNFAALPGDIITGLTTGDIGAYVIVGGLAFLLLGGGLFGGSKSASRRKSRTAALKGAIARDQALL